VVESGQRRTRQGDVERHGGIARCDYVVRHDGQDDRAIGSGQLVAAVDASHLVAVSFFEEPSERSRRPVRSTHDVHASGDDPWRDAPPPTRSPKPRPPW
jgi:hypothetical protein